MAARPFHVICACLNKFFDYAQVVCVIIKRNDALVRAQNKYNEKFTLNARDMKRTSIRNSAICNEKRLLMAKMPLAAVYIALIIAFISNVHSLFDMEMRHTVHYFKIHKFPTTYLTSGMDMAINVQIIDLIADSFSLAFRGI